MFDPTLDHSLTSIASQETFMAIASDWVLRVANREAPPNVHAVPATSSSGTTGTLPAKLAVARGAIA